MKKILLLLVAFTFFLGSTAYAIPWNMNSVNQLSDNSAEYLLKKVYTDTANLTQGEDYLYSGSDKDGSYIYTTDGVQGASTTLEVGDRLRGVFKIDTLEYLSGGLTAYNFADGYEFTGVFELEVASKTENTQVADGYDFIYGPSSDFSAQDEVIKMYVDPSEDYVRSDTSDDVGVATEESVIDTATNGDFYWSFGFTGSDGEGWVATGAPDDISLFKTIGTSAEFGEFNFSLNLIQNPLGPQLDRRLISSIDETSLVDAIGSGGLKGIDDGTGNEIYPFDARNNMDASVAPVPEPTTLLLFGTGLLGLAAFGRKKFMAKKQ